MYVRYKHKDLSVTHKFLEDFGFIAVQKSKTRILYRGFGESPVSYVSEQAENGEPLFMGGGWAVDRYEDLELAANIPGASSITDCEDPIGGKTVTLMDPVGGPMYLHWGYEKRTNVEKPKTLTFNTWDKKRRQGNFQRLEDGPARIHKLGHYGYEVNHSDFVAVKEWYFGRFTLAMSDTLFNPETGNDIMIFAHVDKGKDFTDHHVSIPATPQKQTRHRFLMARPELFHHSR